jgi:hypothetical protein
MTAMEWRTSCASLGLSGGVLIGGFVVKLRMFVLAALVLALAALAVAGAGWKWSAPTKGHAYGPEKVAGWTWDESSVFAD